MPDSDISLPILAAHAILGSLLHASVASDPQSSPAGFAMAQTLGLIEGMSLTRAGEAVLFLLGMKQIDKSTGGN